MTARLSLRSLLCLAKGNFTVPAYQRRYFWGEKRVDKRNPVPQLLADLAAAKNNGSEAYLHCLTLLNRGDAWEIADGQQRLTLLHLLLRWMGAEIPFTIRYECRPGAQNALDSWDFSDASSPDAYFFNATVEAFQKFFPSISDDQKKEWIDFILDSVTFQMSQPIDAADASSAYGMINGTKEAMDTADLIKSELLRLASDANQPHTDADELVAIRLQYSQEWEEWTAWWNRATVKEYYRLADGHPLDLLLRLSLGAPENLHHPLAFHQFQRLMHCDKETTYHAAKHYFLKLRHIQKRFEDAYGHAPTYNRIKAILMLQEPDEQLAFLWHYFVDASIADDELDRCYKLSFLGMTFTEIQRGDSPGGKFEELLAILSLPDVYHNEAKRDAFNLLLRLNIDEDIKLMRRFDFSIWNNRSLEHIYSKSKVWHIGSDGYPYDGNDNRLRVPKHRLEADRTFIPRSSIVTRDGMQLTEHCIGNLVLLYGQNNAAFGNATFEEKQMMFLTPGDLGVFQSRNLLHSVCVFAGNCWTPRQIADNYILTLNNLKLYYGFA